MHGAFSATAQHVALVFSRWQKCAEWCILDATNLRLAYLVGLHTVTSRLQLSGQYSAFGKKMIPGFLDVTLHIYSLFLQNSVKHFKS